MNQPVSTTTSTAERVAPGHPLARRRAGMLCHVTSLPRADGPGTLGDEAFRFIDLLAAAGVSVWQVLPLNPPDPYGSPYQSESLSACSPTLADWGEVARAGGLAAWLRPRAAEFAAFAERHAVWLDDFAIFAQAVRHFAAPWWHWPAPLRDRDPTALAEFARRHAAALDSIRARQYFVFDQWRRVRQAAQARGIVLLGDMPLYPALASADVWANRAVFALDSAGRPLEVAGVPPDYFSATGQLWGNPLYDWTALAADGFRWWLARIGTQLTLFDVVRIDHFRGLEAYWAVPADAPDARSGRWRPAPGGALLDSARQRYPEMPLVAEDLGIITPAVEALRDRFELPGMRVLQFAFSGDPANPHLPENYPEHLLAYTGTHDNDTTLGWYRSLETDVRATVDAYLGGAPDMPWALIETAFESRANVALAPLQDFLGLDGRARMNTPGLAAGNWRWQASADALSASLAGRIRALVERSGRQSD